LESNMIKWFVTFAALAAAATVFAPIPLMAQGVGVEVPGVGGVGVGETRQRDYDRDYDRPYRDDDRDYDRDYDRRHYREHRERRYRGGCKTITIERDDGSVKRIRRCD
jgi:hypothetical protein